jgi:hypothetical protein
VFICQLELGHQFLLPSKVMRPWSFLLPSKVTPFYCFLHFQFVIMSSRFVFSLFFLFFCHVCLCFVLWTNLFLFILSLFCLFKLLVYIVEFWIHVLCVLCCYQGSHSSILFWWVQLWCWLACWKMYLSKLIFQV